MTITKEIEFDLSDLLHTITLDVTAQIVDPDSAVVKPQRDYLDCLQSLKDTVFRAAMKRIDNKCAEMCADGTVHGWIVDEAEQHIADDAEKRLQEIAECNACNGIGRIHICGESEELS